MNAGQASFFDLVTIYWAPLATLIGAIIAIARAEAKLQLLAREVEKLTASLGSTPERIATLEQKAATHESDMEHIEKFWDRRINEIQSRIDHINDRLTNIERLQEGN